MAASQTRVRRSEADLPGQITPELALVLREGYGAAELRADAVSGLTVAIVALPLSMAIAISAGLPPEKGLITAIVGGLLISALGGTRFQIGGPAAAFIVLVSGIVSQHGYDGLILATLLAGVMIAAIGLLRLGTAIRYVPFPVTVGFTAGLAVVILAGQVKDLLGLDIANEPSALLPKLGALWAAIGSAKPAPVLLSALVIAAIAALRRFRPRWPSLLLAVGASGVIAAALQLDVATIGSKFGGIPQSIPVPSLPPFDWAKLQQVFPDAIAIALLGSIESLLSAVVADGMSGTQHRSNTELVAQGVANVVTALFGGMCATGTIARTATNIRAGAHGPVSGMLHAVYVLGFMLVAAPLAAFVPLASLAAVLAIVGWNMVEKEALVSLLRSSPGDAAVLLVTFLLTVFYDLVTAIAVGGVLGSFLFLHRVASAVEVRPASARAVPENTAILGVTEDVMVYRISGTLFFGATAAVSAIFNRIRERPRLVVLDLTEVTLADITAATVLERLARKLKRSGAELFIVGANRRVLRSLLTAGLWRPLVRYASTTERALDQWQKGTGPERTAGEAVGAPA
ncbi:MAG: SulP family inorganic anion transporter [Bauldia sp.]